MKNLLKGINKMKNNVNINGNNVKVPNGASISIIDGVLYINGEKYVDEKLKDKEIVNITIEGNVRKLECQQSVIVNGNVEGDINCGGSVNISGNVEGDIDCGGSCFVQGAQKGSIDAGGSVRVGK